MSRRLRQTNLARNCIIGQRIDCYTADFTLRTGRPYEEAVSQPAHIFVNNWLEGNAAGTNRSNYGLRLSRRLRQTNLARNCIIGQRIDC